jgi:hypothetical protein
MLSSVTSAEAVALSLKIDSEDGVGCAARAFYSHLHVENMICDISLFLGESQLAHVWCQDCGFKMTREVSDVIHPDENAKGHRIFPCSYMNWAALRGPTSATEGVIQGIGGATHEVAGGITNAFIEPMSALYKDGIRGAVGGIVTGLQGLIVRPITGGFVMYNKFSEGLKHMQSPMDSARPSLPDPNLHFTGPGSMERQEASVYGRAAFSSYGVEDCMQQSAASVVSLEAPGHSRRAGNAAEAEEALETALIAAEAATDPSNNVSSDVLALDRLMHSEMETQSLFDSTSSLNSPILHQGASPLSPFSPPPVIPPPPIVATRTSRSSSPDGALVMSRRAGDEEEDVSGSVMVAGALDSDAPEINYAAAMADMQPFDDEFSEEDEQGGSVVSGDGIIYGGGIIYGDGSAVDGGGGSGRRAGVDEFGFEDGSSEEGDELMMSRSDTVDMNSSVPVFAGLMEVI